MSGPRFRIVSGGLAALMVFGLLGTSVAAAATTSAAKAVKVKTTKAARHRTAPSHALKPQVRLAAFRASTQRAKHPLADGALSAENEAITVARHTKKVKLAKPTKKVAPISTKKLKNGTFGPALAAPLDAQFAGLDENNDDLDPLNVGDDYSADTDGAVGPHYYGEVVGSGYGFFDKATGALVTDDSLLDLFNGTGVGSPCEAQNDDGYYEPHILYDSQSDRWIIMTSAENQTNADAVTAAEPDGFGPVDECIAVSASGDPVNGDWYFYSVPLIGAGALDVYQSAAAVWTDGIYFSEVIGCGDTNSLCPGYNDNEELEGSEVWAFNRSDLESGAPLRVQTTQGVGGIGSGNFAGSRTTTTFSNLDADGLVPANLETMTGLPPAGRNEYFMSMSDLPGNADTPLGDGLMDIWQYHVDWTNPANSWVGQSATNQTDYQVTTPTYGVPDDDSGEITSAGPTAYANTLDTNYDYILPKPQYTDFNGVESLWTAHATATCSGSCNSSSTTGPDRVRWNQISISSSTGAPVTSGPTQGQDYAPAPTTLNRWLPAIGVDQDGDMAVGYSGTDSTVFPSLYIAGAAGVASAAANTATIGTIPETEVYAGDGYQTGATDPSDVADTAITAFGPENSMSLDPNGCEMWFAGQVDVGSPTSPTGDDDAWATEITAFHFPGCTPSTLGTSLTTSGSADASAGTGTLTATLTENGTGGSGVVGEVVDFTLGGTPVGTATTDSDGVATLSGVDTSTYSAGTYAGAVGATFAGDSAYNYGASTPATGSLLVGTSQTISFGPITGSYTYGGAGPTLSATASSDLPVTFSATGDNGSTDADGDGVANSGTCSVTGTTVTITGAGQCTITASQAGDGATYLPAPPVSQTFDIAQETQTITSSTTTPTNPTIGTDFQMSATASSGLQVYFTADETNCTEVDNGDTPQDEFVSMNSGTCTIYAEQDGTTDIAPVIDPIPVTITGTTNQTGKFAVTKTSEALSALQDTADDVTWSSGLTDSTYNVSGTVSLGTVAASSALTVAAAATPVTITGAKESSTTVTITVGSNPFSTGNSVVIAGITPAGYDGTYSVTKPSGSAGNTTFTYTDTAGLTTPATSTTGATATLASSGATESGNTVTLTTTASNAGKLTVGDTVSVVGVGVAGYNGNYTIASIPTTTTFTYSDSSSGLTASGGGTVGDTSITGASETGTTVTLNLTAPPGVTLSPGTSTITVAGVTPTTYNGTYTVTALPTSTSLQYTDTAGIAAGGAGTVSQPGTACTASGSLGNESLTALHAGTCTVTATQAGNAGYNSGTATITYTLTAGTQSLTWSPLGGNISATNPTTVSVTTNSGLSPGAVSSTTLSTCTVGSTTTSGGTSTVVVTPVSPGTCTLSAAGNTGSVGPGGATDWNALTTKLTVSLTVANTLADQLIEFAQLPDVTYGVAPFAVSATSVNAYYPEEVPSGTPTGLPISYAASGTCTVDGSGNVTVTGAGICTITASQAGNSAYNPAGSIGNQFTVNQEVSSISFPNPGAQADGTSFSPSATASDGEAVTFTASGDCTTTGNGVIQLTAVGSCTVTAHGVGDANFTPPADTSQTFAVTAGGSSTTTAPTNATIVLGNSNTDTATVAGNATSGSPTGTVSFYECGPTSEPQGCTSQANAVGSPVGLTAGSDNTATATSASFTPTSGGWWCFAGYYSGDSNYGSSTDTTTDECFDVTTAPSVLVTTPTNPTIVAGSGNTDGATVTGNSTGGSPTGTVSFFECGPTADAEPCTSTDNPVGTVGLTAGADDTATATSPSFTASSSGTWCFAGYYSGDSNYSASTDTTVDECFVVSANTSITTTPAQATIALGASDTDLATVPGDSLSGSPTGTVSFYECGPTATPQACTSQADPLGSPVDVTAGADNTATATSPSFTPGSGGYWCFAAYYSGDSNYAASQDTSTTECFDVPPVITSAGTVTFVEGVPATPFQVTSMGGFAPITYTETGTLPSGVTLSSSGVLSGTPGFVAGQFPITITASGGGTGTQSLTLYVTPSSVLHITTTSVPGAQKGVAYSTTLTAAGGKTPYKWKVTSGVLPKGLKMSKKGVISGKPKSNAVSETFTVTVTDKSQPKQTATATFTITVS